MEKEKPTLVVKKNGGAFFDVEIIKNYFDFEKKNINSKVIYVFSAIAGITRLLQNIFELSKINSDNMELNKKIDEFEKIHLLFISKLFGGITKDFSEIKDLFVELRKTVLDKDFVSESHRRACILHFGERASVLIVSFYLDSISLKHKRLNALEHVVTSKNHQDAKIIKIKNLEEVLSDEYEIYIMEGFIGCNENVEKTVLSLDGSDFTAAHVAVTCKNLGYNVPISEFGKDTDGVYDCDPKLNANAKLLGDITLLGYLIIVCKNNFRYPVFPEAVILLAKNEIITHVKSNRDLDKPGTFIESHRF